MRNSNTHRGSSEGPQDLQTTVVATSPSSCSNPEAPQPAFTPGEESHSPPPPHLAAAPNPRGHKKNEIKRPLSDSIHRLFLASLHPKHPNCDHVCATARPPGAICTTEPSVLLNLLRPTSQIFSRSPSRRHNAQPEGRPGTRNQRGLV